jgi:hypothetical protein
MVRAIAITRLRPYRQRCQSGEVRVGGATTWFAAHKQLVLNW